VIGSGATSIYGELEVEDALLNNIHVNTNTSTRTQIRRTRIQIYRGACKKVVRGNVLAERSREDKSARTPALIALPAILSLSSRILREMPRVTPGATIGAEVFGGVGGGDLVRGCCQRFTLGCVLAFSADGAFRFGVHRSYLLFGERAPGAPTDTTWM